MHATEILIGMIYRKHEAVIIELLTQPTTKKRQSASPQLARTSWGKILNSSLSVQRSTVNELLTPTRASVKRR